MAHGLTQRREDAKAQRGGAATKNLEQEQTEQTETERNECMINFRLQLFYLCFLCSLL